MWDVKRFINIQLEIFLFVHSLSESFCKKNWNVKDQIPNMVLSGHLKNCFTTSRQHIIPTIYL